jgi:hypothetical protein
MPEEPDKQGYRIDRFLYVLGLLVLVGGVYLIARY